PADVLTLPSTTLFRSGADHGRHVVGGAPVAVVPPDPLPAAQLVLGGADRGLDAVDEEEPVVGVAVADRFGVALDRAHVAPAVARSEEHTSELQSRENL